MERERTKSLDNTKIRKEIGNLPKKLRGLQMDTKEDKKLVRRYCFHSPYVVGREEDQNCTERMK